MLLSKVFSSFSEIYNTTLLGLKNKFYSWEHKSFNWYEIFNNLFYFIYYYQP